MTLWSRLKRWFGMDFHAQAMAEVEREEEQCARMVVSRVLLDGGNR